MAGSGRWCMICDVQLITQKHYTNLNSSKVNRQELQNLFREVLGDLGDAFTGEHSAFACDKCVAKVKRASTLKLLVREVRDNFQTTQKKHMPTTTTSTSTPSSSITLTPTKSLSQLRSKRMASISPGKGTPSSKVHYNDNNCCHTRGSFH